MDISRELFYDQYAVYSNASSELLQSSGRPTPGISLHRHEQ